MNRGVIVIELGDLREGIMPQELAAPRAASSS
jgi:hypothetical protein